jgi:hypothetical protein
MDIAELPSSRNSRKLYSLSNFAGLKTNAVERTVLQLEVRKVHFPSGPLSVLLGS